MTENPKNPLSQGFSPKKIYSSFTLQIDELKSRIEDLEAAIEINQKIITDVVQSKVSEISAENSDTVSNFSPKVLETMLTEHIDLKSKFKKSLIERNDYQCKSLISQQIATETQLKLIEIESEYKDRIKEYKYQIQIKTQLIEDLSALNKEMNAKKQLQLYSKNSQVTAPKDEIIQKHTRIEALKEFIQISARKCLMASNKRDSLLVTSTSLFNSCTKIQVLLKNPINRKSINDRLEITPPDAFSDKSETSSSSESSEIEFSEKNRSHTFSNKSSVVPVMDFTKIKSIPEKPLITLNSSLSIDHQKSSLMQEMKKLYLALDEKINESTDILNATCEKNKKLQSSNVELVQEYKKAEASIFAKRLLQKKTKIALEEIPELD